MPYFSRICADHTASCLLIVVMVLLCTASAFAEEKKFNISLDAGTWLINWDQKNQSSDIVGSAAIATDYEIESSLGVSAAVNASYGPVSGKFEYFKADDANNSKKNLNLLAGVLNYTGLFGKVDLQFSGLKSTFNGTINASYRDLLGKGEFETDLTIYDMVIFYKYFGIGYRYYNYEFPTDVYVKNTETDTLLPLFTDGDGNPASFGGLDDLRFKGNFIQVVFDNTRMLEKKEKYFGPLFTVRAGFGKLDASSDVADQVDAVIKNTVNGGKSLLGDAEGKFFEADLGVMYKKNFNDKYKLNFQLGYRYNIVDVNVEDDALYSMVTDFKTTFQGPFVKVGILF